MMTEQSSASLELTMRALLLISLSEIDADTQVDILVKAGFGNVEIADLTGMTANAVGLRKSRMKKKTK